MCPAPLESPGASHERFVVPKAQPFGADVRWQGVTLRDRNTCDDAPAVMVGDRPRIEMGWCSFHGSGDGVFAACAANGAVGGHRVVFGSLDLVVCCACR